MVQKTLYIIRHGQTDLNKQGVIQGRGINSDLNDAGRKQGAAFFNTYQHIAFDKIYISELKRTQQTIQQFIDLGIPYQKLAGLDELAWGIYEGHAATPENRVIFKQVMTDWQEGRLDSKFEGGESPNEVATREKEALDEIMSHPDEKTVLICMHGRAMRLFLCLLTGLPLTKMDEFPHQNVILYKVTYDGSRFEITESNNSEHLQNLPADL
ncbi:histidine phosphatase family protein [Mucilaginibacter sp. HMF5004]|uniref:histidine phosphatase family protein n=1 Tax=Mucilaginibacter rivuli TaxID=2857527 RepID=UPI001C602058|nr:histidine phosphatase family protein [Mucilaginibacter rivuli]MBW4891905.1 histidine phosphatase family protein [Mucilaginibacter rivuli]